MQMKGAIVEQFVPQLFQFEGGNVIAVLPKHRDHLSEDSQSSFRIPGSLLCLSYQRSNCCQKSGSIGQAIDHELLEHAAGVVQPQSTIGLKAGGIDSRHRQGRSELQAMLVGGHNQNGISDFYGGGDDPAQSLNQGIVVIVKLNRVDDGRR